MPGVLQIPFETAGLTPGTANALDDVIASIQTWANTLGKWTDITFDAGDYTAAAGAWTLTAGDQAQSRYTVIGQTMIFNLRVGGTTTNASVGGELRVRLPRGYRGIVGTRELFTQVGPLTWDGSAASGTGVILLDPSPNDFYLRLFRDIDGTTWPTETDALALGFTAVFPVRTAELVVAYP